MAKNTWKFVIFGILVLIVIGMLIQKNYPIFVAVPTINFRTTDLGYESGSAIAFTISCGSNLVAYGYESAEHSSYECENSPDHGIMIMQNIPGNIAGTPQGDGNWKLYNDISDVNEIWICQNDADGDGSVHKRYDKTDSDASKVSISPNNEALSKEKICTLITCDSLSSQCITCEQLKQVDISCGVYNNKYTDCRNNLIWYHISEANRYVYGLIPSVQSCYTPQNNNCVETDNGKDVFKKGSLTFSGTFYGEDKCVDGQVYEYQCDPRSDGIFGTEKYSCPPSYTCSNGACVSGGCTPSCSGKSCGDDGCGGSCGTCGSGYTCQNYQCVSSGCPTFANVQSKANSWISGSITFQDLLNYAQSWVSC